MLLAPRSHDNFGQLVNAFAISAGSGCDRIAAAMKTTLIAPTNRITRSFGQAAAHQAANHPIAAMRSARKLRECSRLRNPPHLISALD